MKNHISYIISQFIDVTKDILQDEIVGEYLFGSYATNNQTPLSDIDILIIVKYLTPDMQFRLSSLASEYSLKYDICISPVLTDIGLWNKNKNCNTLFYQEITKNGIRL